MPDISLEGSVIPSDDFRSRCQRSLGAFVNQANATVRHDLNGLHVTLDRQLAALAAASGYPPLAAA